jgi:MoaA/NifB/PqqE/SkfB family radical SAM enzyme
MPMHLKELIKTAYSRIFAVENKLLTHSKVFCMAPWIQLHAQTDGKVAPCCMSAVYDGNEAGDLRQNPNLADAWNSKNMRQLRLNMLNNKQSTICKHCYKYEALARSSEREQYNKDHQKHFSRIENTKPDGSVDDTNVLLIDIRFSNKCNYKCRICNSKYSSLWYEEELQLDKTLGDDHPKEMRAATDDALFWKSYKKMLPHVKRIHFAGGEPLFMDEHYQTLEHLIEIGNKDVVLSYNTNFSTLRYKKYNVIDLWKEFKKVDVWASLDGMSAKGDYQRKGQKWEKIEENIRAVQQHCPSVLFGVNMTVNIFNILDIPAFYRYLVENNFVQPERVNLYLLFEPNHFSIVRLPANIKAKVVQQFKGLEEDYLSTLPNSSTIRNHIKAVITYMMSDQPEGNEEFKHHINTVDALRDENFVSIYPELAEMIDK